MDRILSLQQKYETLTKTEDLNGLTPGIHVPWGKKLFRSNGWYCIASSPGFSKSAHWHAIAVGTCYCKIWGSRSARPENTAKNKQKHADELETVVQTFSSMKWVVSKSLECQKFSRINKLYETGSLVLNRNNGTYGMSAPLATDLDFSVQWAGTRKWINQVYFNICGQELNFVDSVGGAKWCGDRAPPYPLERDQYICFEWLHDCVPDLNKTNRTMTSQKQSDQAQRKPNHWSGGNR